MDTHQYAIIMRRIKADIVESSSRIIESLMMMISFSSLALKKVLFQGLSETFSHAAIYDKIDRAIQNQQKVIDMC